MDEAHYISNSQAQRTKLLNDILAKIPKVWLLTGTPMTSRPINYFNLLKIVKMLSNCRSCNSDSLTLTAKRKSFPLYIWPLQKTESTGFKNVESWEVGKTKDWEGTLVVTGTKK